MLPNSKKTVISRRQAVALAAGVAAFMSEGRVMAQTNPPELPRVEPIQVELDTNRRKTMSYTVSELLLRNLRDVFGENDPARRRAAINELYTEDCVFYDPSKGVYRGRNEIARI